MYRVVVSYYMVDPVGNKRLVKDEQWWVDHARAAMGAYTQVLADIELITKTVYGQAAYVDVIARDISPAHRCPTCHGDGVIGGLEAARACPECHGQKYFLTDIK